MAAIGVPTGGASELTDRAGVIVGGSANPNVDASEAMLKVLILSERVTRLSGGTLRGADSEGRLSPPPHLPLHNLRPVIRRSPCGISPRRMRGRQRSIQLSSQLFAPLFR